MTARTTVQTTLNDAIVNFNSAQSDAASPKIRTRVLSDEFVQRSTVMNANDLVLIHRAFDGASEKRKKTETLARGSPRLGISRIS